VYSDILLDHFHHPRNVGELAGANAIGDSSNGTCGDLMRLFLNIREGKVTEAQFMTLGCAAAIATGSMLTEMIKGKTVESALAITNEEVAAALGGLPAEKIHCSVLAEQAMQAAVKAWRSHPKKKK
jgi:NifU-like protein involved in Fe-S cluster formation